MHDLVLRGGLVVDGLGAPAAGADVAVADGVISAIGRDLGAATRTLELDGLTLAPGFIDAHSHSDTVALWPDPEPFKLYQGVTTEVVGNCGFSFAPLDAAALEHVDGAWAELVAGVTLHPGTFAAFLDRVEAAGPTNHQAVLVGHGALRLVANGMDEGLRPGALRTMRSLAEEAFDAGAIGLSTGLIYVPCAYADTEELVALAAVAGRRGRVYATHLRDEGEQLLPALDEAVTIGRRAGVAVQISHCKAAGRASHGKAPALLERLRTARAHGVDIRGDAYPYTAGSTFLSALLPPRACAGGVAAMRARLSDPQRRQELHEQAHGFWDADAPAGTLVVAHVDGEVVGRTLADLAASAGQDPWDTLCSLVVHDPGALIVIELAAEDDLRAILADPLVSIGSDNEPPVGMQHPRTWGCFPRLFGTYVRELGLLSLEDAVRRSTSATADHLGLHGRGRIDVGAAADLVAFNPAAVGHTATYLAPDARPTGIVHVLLDGQPVVEQGEFTGARAGTVLRAC